MKNTTRLKGIIGVCLLFCTPSALFAATPLGPDNAYTWSIPTEQLAIAPGSIITNAVLTIHNAVVKNTTENEVLYVHLLDNPDTDINIYTDDRSGNYFEGHGIYLAGFRPSDLPVSPSDIVIELVQINDPDSGIWSIFEQPFLIDLADSSQVLFTSSLLSLLDYAGTSSVIGFGLDCDGLTFDGLSVELTIQSMIDSAPATKPSFTYGNVHPPLMQPITDQSINAEQTLSFTVTATDEDNDVLTYSASNLPPGAMFTNQVFTWTPSNQHVGIHPVDFAVSDGGQTVTQTVNITVHYTNHTPVIEAIADAVVTAGNTLTFTVHASDPDGDIVSISAENLPPGASCVNGIFTWTPSTAQIGIYDVLFIANDGQGGLDTASLQITVNPAPWILLAYDDFEAGWGNYTSGGRYCSLYTRTKYAPQGSNAACIENGLGDASSFVLTNGIDVKTPGYSEINITFSYIAVSMDNSNEGFRLDYWDGTKWLTLKSWRRYLDFDNVRLYSETIKIYSSNVVFPTNMKIRFVCEASGNTDLAMIDLITISAK